MKKSGNPPDDNAKESGEGEEGVPPSRKSKACSGGGYVLQQDQQIEKGDTVQVEAEQEALKGELARNDDPTADRDARGPTILTKPNETVMTSPDEMISADPDNRVEQELIKLAKQVEEYNNSASRT